MRVSVVIPTYQRCSLVLSAVQALVAQEFDEDYEIVVVVDGSTDGSAEALRNLDDADVLRVIEQPNRGLSAARNAGAAAARGELLLFLDDDMEADVRLLAEHCRSQEPAPALVLGHIPLHPDSPGNFLSEAVGTWAEQRCRRLTRAGAVPGLKDCVMGQSSIPRTAFLELGGFDTGFTRAGSYGNEDLEFCYRLSRSGLPIVFNPAAVSRQRYVVAPAQHLDQWQDAGRADVRLARKYPELVETLFEGRPPPERRSLVLYRPLRLLCLMLLGLGTTGRLTRKLFYGVRELAHADGVRRAGGTPVHEKLQILCYHAIADLAGTAMAAYGVPPARFRSQLAALERRGYHFVTAEEFLGYLEYGAGLPRRSLLLTFDDCYESVCEAALPVLEQFGVPAVAFAVSGRVGATNCWDARLGAPKLALADVDGLQALERAGTRVAPHSRTHCDLTATSEKTLLREVAGSLAELQDQGLEPLPLFAYPYGEHDQRVRNAVQIAGYVAAVTTEPGIVVPGCNRFRLPRIEVLADHSLLRLRWTLYRDRMLAHLQRRRPRPAEAARVSFVVPAYNAASTLEDALESIRAQTYRAWEVVIVDDGSVDATAEIAAAWCRLDRRFRLVRRQNGGEGAARNTGIGEARAEWLVFLDADDWIAPEYLEQMLRVATRNRDRDAVACGCVRVTPSGLQTQPALYAPGDLDQPWVFARDCPLAIHNCMIRRSAAVAAGGFDESLQTCADWDFWQRVARCGTKFATVPQILALYRMRPGSASTAAAAVLRDGFTVIRRGYGRDRRPSEPCGPPTCGDLRADDLPRTLYRHALWPASMMIAAGGSWQEVIDVLADVGDASLEAETVAEELFYGIPLAVGKLVQSWPDLYRTLEAAVSAFLGDLERVSGTGGLRDRALRLIEQRILEAVRFDDHLVVGGSLGVRVEVTRTLRPVQIVGSPERVVVVVTQSGTVVGSLSLHPCLASAPVEALSDRIVEELAWPLMRQYLGLDVPRGSPVSATLRSLALESGWLRLTILLGRSFIPLWRWQRSAGALRDRVLVAQLFELLRHAAPMVLERQLHRMRATDYAVAVRDALVAASRRCVRQRFKGLRGQS